MRIGLASYQSKNRDTLFNMNQIEKVMKDYQGKVDLVCFGEAFLQGFDSLSWKYDIDKDIAVSLDSSEIDKLKEWTVLYGVSLLAGYIEKEDDKIYSSCVVISNGRIIHNYRRISKGWKEFTITDYHYCEGSDIKPFNLFDKEISIGLCGDLWDYPERFKTNNLFIWPVYVNYSLSDWQSGVILEYANQAKLVSKDVLMVNPIDNDPVNHGGAFYFRDGEVISSIPFDKEDVLIVNIGE